MEKRKVHIEDFFTQKNAKEGIWHEPKIEGEGCGFEFLVIGITTDEALVDDEHFEKLYNEAGEIKDDHERIEKRMRIDAQRCARLVKGIRPAEDCEVDFDGKAPEFSIPLIENIFYESPLIKKDVVEFASRTSNFIKREKNS